MNYSDLMNGIMEMVGCLFCLLNIRHVLKHKTVAGVSWPAVGFFTIWGWWNVYFYSANHLTYSFIGSIFLTLANTLWLFLLIKYNKKREST